MAVKMSIGEENIEENRIYNLTQLRWNNRKRVNKKAGTKKPRPCDKDVTVKMKASENVMILDSSNKKRDYLSQSTQLQLCSSCAD